MTVKRDVWPQHGLGPMSEANLRQCAQCGDEFEVWSLVSMRQYCSDECAAAAQVRRAHTEKGDGEYGA